MYIVTAKEMYDLDHYAMHEIGMDGRLLMENAGRAVSEKIRKVAKNWMAVSVFVGSGNNGGDGFVIARTLLNENYPVEVVQIVPNEKIAGDCLYHKELFLKCGGTIVVTQAVPKISEIVSQSDIVVDAMIGIGVHGPLREPISSIVSCINEQAKCIISVDIPSGLPADEGTGDFSSVQADYTFIIEAAKMSLFLNHTAAFYGEWEVVSIGLPINRLGQKPKRQTWDNRNFRQTMPIRKRYSHKGTHGRGLAIGGSKDMPGSVAMTAKAALRTGAGLLTVGTSSGVISMIASTCVEATYLPLDDNHYDGKSIPFDKFNAIVIGMGLGRDKQIEQLVMDVINNARCPLIVDADGLYHTKADLSVLKKRSHPTIVTPHPGEMAMLLDVTIAEILENPFYFAAKFARDYQVYVVLKGSHTIITAPNEQQVVNMTGNQGLAKGGSGDVLSGIILAMIMQHQSVFKSLCNACFVHGKAADVAVEETNSYYDMLATDVIAVIPKVYRKLLVGISFQ